MSIIKERIPQSAQGPVGIGSLLVGIAGFTIGYVLLVLGVTFYYDLAPQQLPTVDSVIVFVLGVALTVVGYLGLKGFMHFSY